VKFPPVVALILGAVLTAIEAVQLAIGSSLSVQAHDGITIAVFVLGGLGVLAATPTAIAKAIPHWVLVLITTGLGALTIVQTSSFHISTVWHTVIGAVLAAGAALFTTVEPITPPSS
jgi:hypothetical protein